MSARPAQPDLFDRNTSRRLAYPAAPGSKTSSGPSVDAAEQIAPFAPTLRARVLDELKKPSNAAGMTADEIAAALGSTEFATRPRCSELRRAGQIVDSGARRRNRSGINATVWRAELSELSAAQQAAARARACVPSSPQPTEQTIDDQFSTEGDPAH